MTALTPEEYLELPYTIEIVYDDSDGEPGWVARVIELPGCITQGDTFEELGEMIREAMLGWIEIELEDGADIPKPRPVDDYSGKFVVRVPSSLHRDLVQAAERDGVSLNSFVIMASSYSVGRQKAEVQIDKDAFVPHPVWSRLSERAYRAMIAAGLAVEADELNEQLFAGWLERELAQVDAALRSGHIKDALLHLNECRRSLELCGSASPIVAVFAQTTQLLLEQIELNSKFLQGFIGMQQINARINNEVQRSSQSHLSMQKMGASYYLKEQTDEVEYLRLIREKDLDLEVRKE